MVRTSGFHLDNRSSILLWTTMTTNETKKALYLLNPKARIIAVRKTGIHYLTEVNGQDIRFVVPLDEIGDGIFTEHIDAKLLIRWIV